MFMKIKQLTRFYYSLDPSFRLKRCRVAPPRVGPTPPGIAPKYKTNPRSALESIKLLKNEPETNPNEPDTDGMIKLLSALETANALGFPKSEPETNLKRTRGPLGRLTD
jgi:hypothetical protein